MRIILVLIALFVLSGQSYALTQYEFSYNYEKQVYGSSRENLQVGRNYSVEISYFLTAYTAIELGYGQGNLENYINSPVSGTVDGVAITRQFNLIEEKNYRLSLKQALSSSKSFIRPFISLGYAKQVIENLTEYDLKSGDTNFSIEGEVEEMENDSVFGSFSLAFGVSSRFSITTSVQTIFPAFEWEKAKDTLKYFAGISFII